MIPGPFHLPSTHKILIFWSPTRLSSVPFLKLSPWHSFPQQFLWGDMAANLSSPPGSSSMFAAGASRCQDSAYPVTSPIARAENTNIDPISVEEWSDAGSDEEKIGGRMFWSEEDNLRLISAWFNNSNDPIDGN